MVYVVVSCIEREITGEVATDNFREALREMKKVFLDYHRNAGYSEKELEELKLEIESEPDVQTDNYGFCSSGNASAWSNIDDDCNFDIKIIEIPSTLNLN